MEQNRYECIALQLDEVTVLTKQIGVLEQKNGAPVCCTE